MGCHCSSSEKQLGSWRTSSTHPVLIASLCDSVTLEGLWKKIRKEEGPVIGPRHSSSGEAGGSLGLAGQPVQPPWTVPVRDPGSLSIKRKVPFSNLFEPLTLMNAYNHKPGDSCYVVLFPHNPLTYRLILSVALNHFFFSFSSLCTCTDVSHIAKFQK